MNEQENTLYVQMLGGFSMTWNGTRMEADPKDAVTATLDSSSEPELYSSGYLTAGKNVVILTCDTTLKDGFYNAEVVTDELKPITLLFSDK